MYFYFLWSGEYSACAPWGNKVDFRSPCALWGESWRTHKDTILPVRRTGMIPLGVNLFEMSENVLKIFFWDFKINILGKKDETIIHFCDKCELPIRIYGRMLPCKHAFCYACAILLGKEGDKICPSCSNFVQQIEQHSQGSIFVCSTVQGCKRSYLSQRDLQAHINFRHMRARNSVPHT